MPESVTTKKLFLSIREVFGVESEPMELGDGEEDREMTALIPVNEIGLEVFRLRLLQVLRVNEDYAVVSMSFFSVEQAMEFEEALSGHPGIRGCEFTANTIIQKNVFLHFSPVRKKFREQRKNRKTFDWF